MPELVDHDRDLAIAGLSVGVHYVASTTPDGRYTPTVYADGARIALSNEPFADAEAARLEAERLFALR